MSTDMKGVNKFRSSLIYMIFIINFVSMLILQLDITSSGQAELSLKTRVNNQNFTSVSEYVPMDPDMAFF